VLTILDKGDNTMRRHFSTLGLLLLLTLSGCTYTDYQYIPPSSPQGDRCVANCDYDKERCQADEDRANQELRMRYEREMRGYKRCKEYQAKGENSYRCERPYREYAQGFNCDRIYKACFRRCGGKIIAVEKEF
jgi:hypothetical protein